MENQNNQLVLRKDDYEILISCLNNMYGRAAFDRQNAQELKNELKKATLVNEADFPGDVVRLNSRVKIKSEKKDKIMELMIVTPDKADIKKRKISIMAPLGTALIGFRQGQKVKWRVPSGKKTFTIMEVTNDN